MSYKFIYNFVLSLHVLILIQIKTERMTASKTTEAYEAKRDKVREMFRLSQDAKAYINKCIRESAKIDESKLNGFKIVSPV